MPGTVWTRRSHGRLKTSIRCIAPNRCPGAIGASDQTVFFGALTCHREGAAAKGPGCRNYYIGRAAEGFANNTEQGRVLLRPAVCGSLWSVCGFRAQATKRLQVLPIRHALERSAPLRGDP